MVEEILTARQEEVLRSVIHHYILTAKPVGSRVIEKKYRLGLSAASIRNVMADLEEMGYLTHPHTSAGRIPTTKGYTIYVNNLMSVERLAAKIKRRIRHDVESVGTTVEDLLNKTSRILATISSQLGVVIGPTLDTAVIDRITLVNVASDKIMIVISFGSGIIKSLIVEVKSDVADREIEETTQLLNERLCGLTVSDVLDTIGNRLEDVSGGSDELIRLFLESAQKVFRFDEKQIFVDGAVNILDKPEFSEHDKLRSIIELVEQKDVIVHLLNREQNEMGLVIKIGEQDEIDVKKTFSIVSTEFSIGGKSGTLGVIGPPRMWYPKLIPLVDYTAEVINQFMSKEN